VRLQSVCEKCVELDARIARYREMARQVTDELTGLAIRTIIAELNAAKQALHPQGEPSN
jgi:lantibiotic modifying enzyme